MEAYSRANTTVMKKYKLNKTEQSKYYSIKIIYTPTKILHKDLDILLMQDIYKLSIAKFVYKQKNALLPDIFRDLFTENSQVHSHNTNNIHLNHTINKYGKMTTKQQGSNIWNSIPTKIRKAKTAKTFSRKVKTHLLKSY